MTGRTCTTPEDVGGEPPISPAPPAAASEREIGGGATVWRPRRLRALDDAQIDGLAELLIDCVEGSASVIFMHPLSRDRALEFWHGVGRDVAAGDRALLIAEDARGICGTAQLVLRQSESQPHRAYLSKMLVHRRTRRQGLGEALLRAAEATARECGKALLTLDTATTEARRLYERLGWVRVGVIPGYSLLPHGEPCDSVIYYRNLGA